MANRLLYLPMEIASRELDSRLLIAALALARGYEIVLGQKWLIERNIAAMPPGLYLAKTLTRRDARFMQKAARHGHRVAALDEEIAGLLLSPDELRWIAPEAIAAAQRIFVTGRQNRDSLIARFPEAEGRVRAVMNPRWDLLRPSLRGIYTAEAGALRDRHGRFILVNTNLGFINSEKGSAEEILREQARLGKLDLANPADAAYFHDIVTMEKANQAAILALVPRLAAAFPEHRIILRPHPSERLGPWRSAFAGLARVSVIREGPAVPWILASDILIQTNCATGTEAMALDRPSLCLIPEKTASLRRYLSNRVNPVVTSLDEAIALARRGIEDGAAALYTPEMRAAFAAAMSFDAERLGAESILDEMESIPATTSSLKPSKRFAPGARYVWYIPEKNVRGALFPSLPRRMVRQNLGAIAAALALEIPLRVQACGAKVVLLGPHRLPFASRIRRYVSLDLLGRAIP